MTLDNIPGRDKLEPPWNIGSKATVGIIDQHLPHARRHIVIGTNNGTGRRDDHVEPLGMRSKAFMLNKMFGEAIGHLPIKRIERHRFITWTLWVMARRA